jgi:DNA repair exonuclease SbcCD nuclease subunit
MKFIHTSDWQLGMAFGHIHAKAEALRRARMDAVKQVIALAEKEKAEFDDNRIAPSIVEEAARILKNSLVPIFLLPGNHDPFTQDSPYVRRAELFGGNALVLNSETPVTVSGGTLYPCPARSRNSTQDPTAWIPLRENDSGIRIGVAHGSAGTPVPNDFPIAAKVAITKGLDYLALGHWHGAKKIDERTWYCGTPEATAFGQANAGKALVVEVPSAGAPAVVREVPLAKYQWREVDAEVHDATELESMFKEVESHAAPNVLLRLRMRGSLSQACFASIDDWAEEIAERFFHLKIDNQLHVENGVHEYRHPLLHEMSEILMAKVNQGDVQQAEIARRALAKMRTLVRHAGFTGEEV